MHYERKGVNDTTFIMCCREEVFEPWGGIEKENKVKRENPPHLCVKCIMNILK